MTINFTKLNKRITLQSYELVTDDLGNATHQWYDLITLWARVEPIRPKMKQQRYIDSKENDYYITVRYTKGITCDMRIKYNDRILRIEKIINSEEDFKFLTIYTSEE